MRMFTVCMCVCSNVVIKKEITLTGHPSQLADNVWLWRNCALLSRQKCCCCPVCVCVCANVHVIIMFIIVSKQHESNAVTINAQINQNMSNAEASNGHELGENPNKPRGNEAMKLFESNYSVLASTQSRPSTMPLLRMRSLRLSWQPDRRVVYGCWISKCKRQERDDIDESKLGQQDIRLQHYLTKMATFPDD